MRVGIQLPEVERRVPWPEYLAMARTAEAVGFDSLWLGDHLLYRGDGRAERGPWETWTLLAALAAATERITLGPLVACAAFHPPALLAKMAATIAEISGGRFTLALGAGWNEAEFNAFGLPFDHRVARFEESFTIVRRLLAGERVTVDGRHWQTRDALLLPRPQYGLRLMIGSNGPRMLAATLPHVDAWNTWYEDYGNAAEGFARLNAKTSEAARRVGRDPLDIARSACVFVDFGPTSRERPVLPHAPPVRADRLAPHLRELADTGADEAILVVSPITEDSITHLAESLALKTRSRWAPQA